MTKWLTVIIPLAIAVIDQLADVLGPYIAAHPKVALWISALTAVATAVARSPLALPPAAPK